MPPDPRAMHATTLCLLLVRYHEQVAAASSLLRDILAAYCQQLQENAL